ncbi:MAG: ATP-binding protein [Deltaproteobacteria bacterium]|nr:ATP-binding protein [Deltaproteobacteria bacterium]
MKTEELLKKIKYLRLNGLAANLDNYLRIAQKGNFSHFRLLQYIIEEEYKLKQENSRRIRMNRSKIPEKYVMETFPFSQQSKLNKKKLLNLYDTFDMSENGRNVIWIGPTGVGKTGLATAFLIQAITCGHNGRFISFPELIELLYQSIGDHSESNVIKTFASYDFLLIDELGYVEVEPSQVGLFFNLMQKRHKKKATFITSNLGFSQWTSFLNNPQLTAALIDRLTENSHIVNMNECVSLRAKLSPM